MWSWSLVPSLVRPIPLKQSRPKKSRHFLMHWMSVKLPDNFQMKPARHECSHIWKLSGNFIKKCGDFLGRDILGTTFFQSHSIELSFLYSSYRFPRNTLTHSTNEDLLNIKRKCDPEVSYPLSYVRYHWNPEPYVIKVMPRYIGDDFF
jgi:hypothetical protein